MKEPRWQTIAESEFPWEREALTFVREKLPDADPYFAWSNFEFIADDGTLNEVDLLVLTPAGLFLVEIKSRPGLLRGDATTWVWEHERKVSSTDNPLFLANRKAKKLASLLKRQKAVKNIKFPYLDALIFCSAETLACQLQGIARTRVCFRDTPPNQPARGKGIIGALVRRDYDGAPNLPQAVVINRPTAKAVCAALEEAGIRPSQKSRRVGDYLLKELLDEDSRGNFQDWRAEHSKIPGDRVRIRIYGYRKNATAGELESLKRAAHREYNLGSNLTHPGILQVRQYTETEFGPAVIFQHSGESLRLDHYLRERGAELSLDQRLHLIRGIAEAVRFAHEKRVVHRALSPQSVLLDSTSDNFPKIRVFNWQTGSRFAKGTNSFEPTLSPTSHPEELIEEISTVYLAPEAGQGSDDTGEHLDIFSLGAIAFHIFSGKPPAATVEERNELLKRSKGLQISSVMNGAGVALQKFIRESTNPEVLFRTETVAEFLGNLDKVEEELTRPDDDISDQPLEAKVGQTLSGGLIVRGRLGSGASAVAFLVRRQDEKEFVLKLANDPAYNDRLREEAEVVSGLNHQNIVRFVENVEIGGLAGFLMNSAGSETLSKRLFREGRLQIEFLQRFGDELLSAVKYLEEMGVHHRDIKPDNIGIGPRGKDGKLSLTLFDFSLSRTSVDNIRVGTTHYLDPFLPDRKRWDLAAERFSAAVVLYEMATGVLPKWGDGLSRPDLVEGKPNIEAELFDPGLREPMVEFFTRAFQPDASLRFDNAEEMDREWRDLFAGIEPARETGEKAAFDATILEAGSLETPVSDLGLSLRAASALNRIHILTIRDVIAVNPRRLRRYLGVGSQTRRELVELQEAARSRFGAVVEAAVLEPSAGQSEPTFDNRQAIGVDQLAKQVRETAGREKAVGAVARGLLGLEDESLPFQETGGPIRLADVQTSLPPDVFQKSLGLLRERWRKNPSLGVLRDHFVVWLEAVGGVMSFEELTRKTLIERGSDSEEPRRTRLAASVVRAAVEAERAEKSPRFVFDDHIGAPMVALNDEIATYARLLGEVADRLAKSDPLASPARALEDLRAIEDLRDKPTADDFTPLPETRLLRLAAEVSTGADLSSFNEFYPRGMASERALRLAVGALSGVQELTVEEMRRRVLGRYPKAEPLPDRPRLDELLAQCPDLDFEWRDDKGSYVHRSPNEFPSLTSYTSSTHFPTTIDLPESPETLAARDFETRLARAEREGAFLALAVVPHRLPAAESRLLERFKVRRRNLDELFITAMRERAATARIQWKAVIEADAEGPDGKYWRNLMRLVEEVVPIVERELAAPDVTTLVVYPGLLARYGKMNVLERLRDRAGSDTVHGVWVLLPANEQSALPMLDGEAVPVFSAGQWTRIPDSWALERAHPARM